MAFEDRECGHGPARGTFPNGLAERRDKGRNGFTPPGHRQGRGKDLRTLKVVDWDAFRSNMLPSAGVDDRVSSNGYLKDAQQLIAQAVGADHPFFSSTWDARFDTQLAEPVMHIAAAYAGR